MKNKLSNVYSGLYKLNEELVNIERFTPRGNSYEVWDIDFDSSNNRITNATKKDISAEQVETDKGVMSLSQITEIARRYSSISPAEILKFYEEKRNAIKKFVLRKNTETMSPASMIQYLNDHFKNFCLGDNKSKSGKGIGELACHLAFETTNWNNSEEPDVVVLMHGASKKTGQQNQLKISVKSFKTSTEQYGRGSARTGESEYYAKTLIPKISALKTSLNIDLGKDVGPNELYDSLNNIQNLHVRMSKINEIKEKINDLKKEIIGEHHASHVFIWTGFEFTLLRAQASRPSYLQDILSTIGLIYIKGSNSRVSFTFNPAFSDDYPTRYPDAYITSQDILNALNNDSDFSGLDVNVKIDISNYFQYKYFTRRDMRSYYAQRKSRLNTVFKNQDSFAIKLSTLLTGIEKPFFKSYTDSSEHGRTFMEAIAKIENETAALMSSPSPRAIQANSYVPKGKTLKEVYSNLYGQKKNIT